MMGAPLCLPEKELPIGFIEILWLTEPASLI